MHRQVVINFFVWALIGIAIIFLEPIYLACNQDPMIAKNAASYMQKVYPFLFLDALSMPLLTFASAQKVVRVAAVSVWVSTIYYAVASYYLYSVRDMGLSGIAYAVGSMFTLRALIICLMVYCSSSFEKFDDCHFFSKETFTNYGPLLKIDLQGFAMTIWSAWAFDMITFMATYLGAVAVASQTIIRSIAILSLTLAAGYSYASKIFIGHCVGKGKHQHAKMYYCVNLTCSLITISLIVILQRVFQNFVLELYTYQHDIKQMLSQVWLMFLAFQVLEVVQD